VIVKLWPGKSEQQKNRLAEAIIKDVMDILHYGEESVSVAMEEVKSQDWVGGTMSSSGHRMVRNRRPKSHVNQGSRPRGQRVWRAGIYDHIRDVMLLRSSRWAYGFLRTSKSRIRRDLSSSTKRHNC